MNTTTKKPRQKNLTLAQQLRLIGACQDACDWVGNRTAQQAWDECENPNWMMWLLATTMPDKAPLATRRKIVRLACDFAKPALKHVPPGETRPAEAIRLAEKWAKGGKVTVAELEEAASSAAAAASSAAAVWAAWAVWASSSAAAVWAASSAAAAASSAAAEFAVRTAKSSQVKLIRKYFPKCPRIEARP